MTRTVVTTVLIAAAAIGGVAGIALPGTSAPSEASALIASVEQERAAGRLTICRTGGGTNCVVDDDTAWMGGVKVRVADIDAPETHPPRCEREAELGERATLRLAALMNAGPFELRHVERDVDRHGRRLRVLTRIGRSLGDHLVAEGLARTWEGRRRSWCP